METHKQRILVVDDEVAICDLMKINLEIAGYEVDVAYSAEQVLKMDLSDYSLMVFDIMMGEMSGLELLSRVRSNPKVEAVPVIVCTAVTEENSLLDGFSRGADDYIRKPFSMREFVARVQRSLQRSNYLVGSASLEYKTLTLDRLMHTCLVDGEDVGVTKREYDLLSLFLSNRNHIFSRDEILEKVWEKNTFVVDRAIDVNINRLRKKIRQYGNNIITKQGYGYGFKENI